MKRDYHDYVFKDGKLVGNFDKMYRDTVDPWHQSDQRELRKTITAAILKDYNFNTVIDLGCGTGHFTHLLKKKNNIVVGVDMSSTAVEEARSRYPDIRFVCSDLYDYDIWPAELIVVMGVLAYMNEWKLMLRRIRRASHVLIQEYIPKDTMGYVKSVKDLICEVERFFTIKTKVLLNDNQIFLFAERREV